MVDRVCNLHQYEIATDWHTQPACQQRKATYDLESCYIAILLPLHHTDYTEDYFYGIYCKVGVSQSVMVFGGSNCAFFFIMVLCTPGH